MLNGQIGADRFRKCRYRTANPAIPPSRKGYLAPYVSLEPFHVSRHFEGAFTRIAARLRDPLAMRDALVYIQLHQASPHSTRVQPRR